MVNTVALDLEYSSPDTTLVDELKDRVRHMEENAWTQSMDAQVWAQKFMEYKKRMRWTHADIDESLMISWFANAIMAGYDAGTKSNSMGNRDVRKWT